MNDDQLTDRLTQVLHRRADAVPVEDRLAALTDGVQVARLSGSGTRPRPSRVLFAAAAGLALVAAAAGGLLLRPDSARLDPAETTTAVSTDGASATAVPTTAAPAVEPATHVYPILGDLGELNEMVSASADETTEPSSVLTLGRRSGTEVVGVITVTVTPLPARLPTGPEPSGPTVQIGDREVISQAATSRPSDLRVWMRPDASAEEIDAMRRLLDEALMVDAFFYSSQEAVFAEFQQYYANQPEILHLVEPEQLPTHFEVSVGPEDSDLVRTLGEELEDFPGVSTVETPNLGFYEWEEAGALVTVTAGPDAESVIAGLEIVPAPNLPQLRLAEAPAGLEVLDGPSMPWPEPRTRASLYAQLGEDVAVDVDVSDRLDLSATTRASVVLVGGTEGFLVQDVSQIHLSWLVEPGRWAKLSTQGMTVDQTRQIAEDVTFTDRDSWEDRFSIDLDAEVVTVDTTLAETAEVTASSAAGTAPATTPG